MLQNPISRMPLFQILDSNRVDISNGNKKKIYNFYIEFNENYKNEDSYRYGNDTSHSKIIN